ncbi:MAG: polysaccharide export protein [Alphaproteobacteria bacterium]|nr:polysaccharide export protein [Alphaproteobacteria bacterium]
MHFFSVFQFFSSFFIDPTFSRNLARFFMHLIRRRVLWAFIGVLIIAAFLGRGSMLATAQTHVVAQEQKQAAERQEEVLEKTLEFSPGQAAAITSPPPQADKNYRLGVDDVLRISVYGEPELTQTYRVGASGSLSFPLIGEVSVAGRTVAEVELLIAARLAEGYLVTPSVAVQVEMHRPFYILGEVRTPGSYAYVADMSIMNAVALAGGFTYRANRNAVEVVRTETGGNTTTQDVPIESKVTPGDIILVKERFF